MTPRKLRIVEADAPPEGKHIGDEMRALILKRDWAAAHVWADRQKPVAIADVRRVKRG